MPIAGTTGARLRRTARTARASAETAEDDRAARDQAIWDAETGGWTQRQIADATGLHQTTVADICAKQARVR